MLSKHEFCQTQLVEIILAYFFPGNTIIAKLFFQSRRLLLIGTLNLSLTRS